MDVEGSIHAGAEVCELSIPPAFIDGLVGHPNGTTVLPSLSQSVPVILRRLGGCVAPVTNKDSLLDDIFQKGSPISTREFWHQECEQEWQQQHRFNQYLRNMCTYCDLSETSIWQPMTSIATDGNHLTCNANDKFEPALGLFVERVRQTCSWLQIHGHDLHRQICHGRGRNILTLRFHIRGLPWAKRAKWQQPLLWAVSALLQRHGADVAMHGGDLLATLDHGASLRLDFVACRQPCQLGR